MKIKLIRPTSIAPRYAHGPRQDAGLDLFADIESPILLPPGCRTLIRCGFSVELDPGTHGEIRPRSGAALKHGITVLNSPGTVDPSYRGEVGVILTNLGFEKFRVNPGDRIAQMVITRYEQVEIEVVEDLANTERGQNGFGSTGV